MYALRKTMPQAQVVHPLCVTSEVWGHSLHYIVIMGHMHAFQMDATITVDRETQ